MRLVLSQCCVFFVDSASLVGLSNRPTHRFLGRLCVFSLVFFTIFSLVWMHFVSSSLISRNAEYIQHLEQKDNMPFLLFLFFSYDSGCKGCRDEQLSAHPFWGRLCVLCVFVCNEHGSMWSDAMPSIPAIYGKKFGEDSFPKHPCEPAEGMLREGRDCRVLDTLWSPSHHFGESCSSERLPFSGTALCLAKKALSRPLL